MTTPYLQRRSAASSELRRHRGEINSEAAVESLCSGLDLLNELLFNRIDRDVEQNFDMDSMMMPPSARGELKASARVRTLIDVYSAVVAAEEIVDRRYTSEGDQEGADWVFAWVLRLRLEHPDDPSIANRVARYRELPPDERRLQFASSLERRMPHAMQAPLVTYRLYPLGVRIVAATAFGDHARAEELRNQQTALLPVISDCHECHGRPLENGRRCGKCSNPLWSYDWLTTAD